MATEIDNQDTNVNGDKPRHSGNAEDILMKIKLDLAYCSEKVLNLDILLMHVSNKAMEHENTERIEIDDEYASADFMQKHFEFDVLSGVLDSGVKELDDFMTYLGREILDARQKVFLGEQLEPPSDVIEKKLLDAEASLTQSQEQVSEIRSQLLMFRENIKSGNTEAVSSENSQFSTLHGKQITWAVHPQRHALQMLEKSLARELDLEKDLSDARQNQEELKLKLHYAVNDIYCIQEETEAVQEQLFEAENSAEAFLGISKDLASRLEFAHSNSSGAKSHQIVRATSEHLDRFVQDLDGLKSMLEEAENKSMAAKTHGLHLRETVTQLEMRLKSDIELQYTEVPAFTGDVEQTVLEDESVELESVIATLNKKLLKAEGNADNAEDKFKSLMETNAELTRELVYLKENGAEKAGSLERQLEESSSQLEHAKASAEAIEEQRTILYSAISEMANLIDDLKRKVSKAEERAESAESKCSSLTETNSELGKELEFLRGKLESLETSFRQANDEKLSNAKEISVRTKTITDLVMKLASEREQLLKRIFTLQKEKKMILERYQRDCSTSLLKNDRYRKQSNSQISLGNAETESSTTNFQVNKVAAAPLVLEGKPMQTASEDDSSADSKSMPVRTIETGQIRCKHIVLVTLVLLISALVMRFSQSESGRF